MAISPPTSVTRRRLCPRPDEEPRDSFFNSVLTGVREALTAGAMLDIRAAAKETAAEKRSTLPSRDTGTALIASLKLSSARTMWMPKYASISPMPPPSSAMTRPSVTQAGGDTHAVCARLRHADGEFFLPSGAREQQAGDIGAGDEEHKADDGHDHGQRRADAEAVDKELRHCADGRAPAAFSLGEVAL